MNGVFELMQALVKQDDEEDTTLPDNGTVDD